MKTYTAPIFVPIKLAGKVAGACKFNSTAQEYVCPAVTTDKDLGRTVFNDDSVCDLVDDGYEVCYLCCADSTIYNS